MVIPIYLNWANGIATKAPPKITMQHLKAKASKLTAVA